MLRVKVNLKGNFHQELYLAIPDVRAKMKQKDTIPFPQRTASLHWLNLRFKSPKPISWPPQPCLWRVLVISRNFSKKKK